ncbi:FAD-dependent oxidoreductase [Planctomycetaceae bacterium SH139]
MLTKLSKAPAIVAALRCVCSTLCCLTISGRATADTHRFDVVIYGGTSAAVAAAVQTSRLGKSVAIVCPETHLGGLSSGGLGWTDTGNKEVIGGVAREFYQRVWQHYQEPDAWRWQQRAEYGNRGQGTAAIDGEKRTMWIFEPHVAEAVFEDWIKEEQILVFRDQWLDRQRGVDLEAAKIQSIRSLQGDEFFADVFIDATYEGDLMAAAGVSYEVGRESMDRYQEKWAGVQTGVLHHRHHFGYLPPISPYRDPDDPTSGVLPLISETPPGEYGSADKRIQAYCFRMCLTNHEENRVPFARPPGYDPDQYALLKRIYEAGWDETFDKFDPIPNRKTDTNNHGPVSTDYIGANYDYPEASYERRGEIIAAHRRYQQGWLYFIANDPSVPPKVRAAMSQWGLAADEFVDNDHWPRQIYVREARRMLGQYVMTEHELLGRRPTPQSVGMGSYTIDSHNVQRYITSDGHVQNEGDIGVSTPFPYTIAWGALLPRQAECENLVVPVCVSSSHVAFGSIRMEPVFMILGQSAATMAVLAIKAGSPVQAVSYPQLREQLLGDGQVLEWTATASRDGMDPLELEGIVVDDREAEKVGQWQLSAANTPYVAHGYLHDGNRGDGAASVRFTAQLPGEGIYQVRLYYPANSNRATNVVVEIQAADGKHEVRVNQRQQSAGDQPFVVLGEFPFRQDQPATVLIHNRAADGYVIADAVQWVPAQQD